MAEYLSQFLTLPVQAHLAVHIQIQCVLGGVDSPAQFLPLLQQGHEEGGYLVGVAGILAGSSFLHYGILSIGHDLAPKMSGLDLDDIAPVLKDGSGLTHQAFQFILESKRIFHIHGSYLPMSLPGGTI